ncbi:uncharacterized protein [Cicer arietinum]|uniref:uncharacterized protein n=1 Tax=Cicer arietinum TaxID=3827 RepID=UPI003CC62009
MCLVLDVTILPKFKVPEFEKYKGATCPRNHLTMYCRKMASNAHSLSGESLSWYMHLERNRMHSWKYLADAFLRQYRIESGMRNGKIVCAASGMKTPQTTFTKKKEGDANALLTNPRVSYSPTMNSYRSLNFQPQIPYIPYPYVVATSQASYPQYHPSRPPFYQPPIVQPPPVMFSQQNPWNQNPIPNHYKPQINREKKVTHFDPIPVTYDQLLPHLLQNSMVVLRPMKPLEPPFPKWYNPNAKCEHHAGAEDGPNIQNNPLSGHGDAVVNFIEEEIDQYTKDDYVSTIEPCMENNRSFPRPFEILYRKENPKPTHSGKNAIIVQAPTTFPYENNKAVPWSYEVTSHLVNHQSCDIFKPQVVGNITANSGLSSSDVELPVEGMEYNKALHISVRCHDHILARLLVDNGSLLNVMPKSTLSKLFVDGACLKGDRGFTLLEQ